MEMYLHSSMEMYLHSSEDTQIQDVLVGRKVVSVDEHKETLTLDNGTVLKVDANEGCGGCSSGWFELTQLNTCDNVITSASVDYSDTDDAEVVTLFVYAENTQIKLIESTGDTGNGYYGSGFSITVHPFN